MTPKSWLLAAQKILGLDSHPAERVGCRICGVSLRDECEDSRRVDPRVGVAIPSHLGLCCGDFDLIVQGFER